MSSEALSGLITRMPFTIAWCRFTNGGKSDAGTLGFLRPGFDHLAYNRAKMPSFTELSRHCAVLGVAMRASQEDIRLAYRRALLRAHPDKGGSHEQFLAVKEAYEALKDPRNADDEDEEDGSDNDAGEDLGNFTDADDIYDDQERDGTYLPSDEEATDSDGSSDAEDSGSEVPSGNSTPEVDPGMYDYGDLEEEGGSWAVRYEDGTETSLREHEAGCDCNYCEQPDQGVQEDSTDGGDSSSEEEEEESDIDEEEDDEEDEEDETDEDSEDEEESWEEDESGSDQET